MVYNCVNPINITANTKTGQLVVVNTPNTCKIINRFQYSIFLFAVNQILGGATVFGKKNKSLAIALNKLSLLSFKNLPIEQSLDLYLVLI